MFDLLKIEENQVMGKKDNRRTFKMKRKKSQVAKKARIKAKIQASLGAKKSAKK